MTMTYVHRDRSTSAARGTRAGARFLLAAGTAVIAASLLPHVHAELFVRLSIVSLVEFLIYLHSRMYDQPPTSPYVCKLKTCEYILCS